MGWALIITALCVDLAEMAITWVGFIAVGGILSEILALVAGFGFWVWFSILGVSMSSNTKRFAVGIASFLIEIIPGFDAIPLLSWMWTLGMIFTVIMTRMEDEGETPSLSGALKKVQSYASANPANIVVSQARKRIFPKPQGQLENGDANENTNDTMSRRDNVREFKRPNINNVSEFKKAA